MTSWPAALAVALPAALLLAWWPWRGALGTAAGRVGAAARAVAIAAVLLLLLDPGIRVRATAARPLVLLDRSVSMLAGGRDLDSLAATLVALGDTASFGTRDGLPATPTRLADALLGALGGGRPVVVVTDGEVADAALLPADARARATVRAVPRPAGRDVAVVAVRAPARIAAGDTLAIEVAVRATGRGEGTASLVIRDGTATLDSIAVPLGADGSGRATVQLPWPAGRTGERWLEVARVGPADAEPGTDVRWHHLVVTPTPGVVVLAARPDVDARALYRALRDVLAVPVRGYVALQPGRWWRMDDLAPVTAAEVTAAARAADLVAVRGDTAAWRTAGRARLLWPGGGTAGDWYPAAVPLSPLSATLGAEPLDTLPPLPALAPLAEPAGGWVGLTAQRARRGESVPAIVGHDGPAGRTVIIGGQGFHRWAMRGGAADQAWRGAVAAAAGWLLASPPQDGARAVPTARVVQRGRPVGFRWTGAGAPAPVPVTLAGDAGARTDTLRFGSDGEARLTLPVGRHRIAVAGVDVGTVGVEPYSDELVAGPVTVPAAEASIAAAPTRRALRDLLPLFGLAAAGFALEWVLRRRLGLR